MNSLNSCRTGTRSLGFSSTYLVTLRRYSRWMRWSAGSQAPGLCLLAIHCEWFCSRESIPPNPVLWGDMMRVTVLNNHLEYDERASILVSIFSWRYPNHFEMRCGAIYHWRLLHIILTSLCEEFIIDDVITYSKTSDTFPPLLGYISAPIG